MTDYSKYDDEQLIGFIYDDGEEKECAFREIYNRYDKKMYSYCFFKTKNSDDAKDLFQEVWTSFYIAITERRFKIVLPNYLKGIARNIFHQNHKKYAKYKEVNEGRIDFNLVACNETKIEDSIEKEDLIRIISLSSNYLNEAQKETFALKWFSGLSIFEIATITGETTDNVKQRSHRSMQKILRMLAPVIAEVKI